ncbi:hypothetical protein LAG90_19720 [Marinilongibacter aquaticus]|uniref:TolB family protein n=1 Tax=Marinilongibacter aquaticus TaxID=2975157 RepID=UPI0021BD1825|nr:hypothetical protein [Marinilongibacter aquaticus]UBM59031.1 hypothetical protein LAG90_19720 [Marinilongibacter aquaticus]
MKRLNILFITTLTLSLSCKKQNGYRLDLDTKSPTTELFAENIISTNLYERDIAINAEATEIVFTRGDYTQNTRALVSIKKVKGEWVEAEIMPFSGQFQDIEPFFSPDNQRLYFVSNRPIYGDSSRADYNIWFTERTAQTWTPPKALDSLINTTANEFYPSVSENGNLYFTAMRKEGIGKEDIFLAKFENGQYQQPFALDSAVNSTNYEFNAYISPDEKTLIFSSFGRKDDLGGSDLYISEKNNLGQWTTARNLGPQINSEKLDYCPFIDWPRKNFYFSSERTKGKKQKIRTVQELEEWANRTENGLGNIYRISLDALNIENKP